MARSKIALIGAGMIGGDEGDLGTGHLKSCRYGEKASARGLAPL